MRQCIVTIAYDAEHPRYVRSLARMIRSLGDVNDPTRIVAWINNLPPNVPQGLPLPQSVYCAKPFAVLAAIEAGYEYVLWLDSNLYAIHHLADLFGFIGATAYYLQANGFCLGEWCSDVALESMGISREEAMTIPEASGCAIGFDATQPQCVEFIKEWAALAADGKTFLGGHANDIALETLKERGLPWRTISHVSDDSRVLGHRHDQSVLTGLAWKRGWTLTPRPRFVDYWTDGGTWGPKTLLLNDGKQT
jgi:hypothetical protein